MNYSAGKNFAARMTLLMAINAFGLERRH